MKYLLDTDVIIDHLRGKATLDKKVVHGEIFVSIISYGELLFGAYKSSRVKKTLAVVSTFLNDLSVRILTLDEEIINEYAKNKAVLEKKGAKLDDFDLLIASTAKVSSCVLLTRNVKHFKRFPGLSLA